MTGLPSRRRRCGAALLVTAALLALPALVGAEPTRTETVANPAVTAQAVASGLADPTMFTVAPD